MHYSRLILNPRSRAVRRDLADAFQMHRSVMSAFPQLEERDRSDPESGSILWRVDTDQRSGVTMLIVQSELAPDWGRLLGRQPDYVAAPAGDERSPVDTKERTLALSAGQVLSFRLRANPTKKRKSDGRKNGIRIGLVTEEEQLAWLQRKAEAGGFRLHSVVVIPEESGVPRPTRRSENLKDQDSSGGLAVATAAKTIVDQKMTHVAVRFEGILLIIDPVAFQQTLRCGIGSAKGFGFGLLSVARA